MKIPFNDLKKQYLMIKNEIDKAVMDVIDSSQFIKGSTVHQFEKEFSEFEGVKHCVGVGNGTDAIFLALKALGIGAGDEVITVPNTFIATSEAISMTGATIVWCDIDEKTYLMKTNLVESLITERTKAILPVHLHGNVVDLVQLRKIANKYNIKLISDSAQAHGAKIDGKSINEFSDASTYSFYPGKNLGAYGDAGAVTTNDDTLANKIRMLADHGRSDKYEHEYEGVNSRLDSIQAAILSVKLKYLPEWTLARQKIATLYNNILESEKRILLPFKEHNVEHVYHLYVIRLPYHNREIIQEYILRNGVSSGIHYPIPLFNQAPYKKMQRMDCFVSIKNISDQILSLPIYPELDESQINYVGNCLIDALSANAEVF